MKVHHNFFSQHLIYSFWRTLICIHFRSTLSPISMKINASSLIRNTLAINKFTTARLDFFIKYLLLYCQIFSREENFAVSQFFCQIAKFNFCECQDFLPTANFTSTKFQLWKPRNFNPMLNFCNINYNMACFRSRIWKGRWNSWN